MSAALAHMQPGDVAAMRRVLTSLAEALAERPQGTHAGEDEIILAAHRQLLSNHPQALLILPPLWYLVAWDTTRQDFRHFRMDRISRAEAIAQTSYRRRHVPFSDDVCPLDTIMG